jgi:hypothetical protein
VYDSPETIKWLIVAIEMAREKSIPQQNALDTSFAWSWMSFFKLNRFPVKYRWTDLIDPATADLIGWRTTQAAREHTIGDTIGRKTET